MTKKRTSNKKPEKSELQKVAFWKGEVSKLRKLFDKINKRLTELENSVTMELPKNKTTKKEKEEESFRDKFMRENYPGNKE